MVNSDFVQLLRQLASLTKEQQAQARCALDEAQHKPVSSIASVLPGPDACPHCHAPAQQLRPWGFSHGLARLRCHACRKTSNALTGTSLAHLRKREQWLLYAQALMDGVSVREAAGRCGVDKNTAFLWRHRFLKAASAHRAEHEGGIVEADETFFLESFKGQRKLHRVARKRGGVGAKWEQIAVLVVRDRSGQTADFRIEQIDTSHITAVLQPLIEKEPFSARTALLFTKRLPKPRASRIDLSMFSKTFVSLTVRFTSKTSTPTTVASKAGCSAFTGWPPNTWRATSAGDACLSAIAKASHLLIVYGKHWGDFNRNS
jgi:transposase-like protein